MAEQCPACGTRIASESAVEVATDSGPRRYCSGRCAHAEGDGAARTTQLPELPRRIVVAVDGSGPSLRAVEMAASLARSGQGEVRLLHAIDAHWLRALDTLSALPGKDHLGMTPDVMQETLRDDAKAQLEAAVRICEDARVPYTTQVEFHAPREAVVAAAEQADLVVIGSRGLGAVSGAVLGSLSQRVIGATRTPVLVVH